MWLFCTKGIIIGHVRFSKNEEINVRNVKKGIKILYIKNFLYGSFFILTTKFKVSNNYPTKSSIFKIETFNFFCLEMFVLWLYTISENMDLKKIIIKCVQNYPIFWWHHCPKLPHGKSWKMPSPWTASTT